MKAARVASRLAQVAVKRHLHKRAAAAFFRVRAHCTPVLPAPSVKPPC